MQMLTNINTNLFSNSTQESKSTRNFRGYNVNMSMPVQIRIKNDTSSGMRNLKTVFETVSDWLVVKWSVLIGREQLSRD